MPLTTGEILVTEPGFGKILLVRPQSKGTADVPVLIKDLHNPQGMSLHSSNGKLHLYVGESNQAYPTLRRGVAGSAVIVLPPDLELSLDAPKSNVG